MTSLVVPIVDASFEEQISEVAASVSRSRPEAERDAFIAGFRPKSSASAADEKKEGEDDSAAPTTQPEVPLPERRSLLERLVGEIRDAGEGSDKDVEGAFNLLTALVIAQFEGEESKQVELLSQLTKAVSASGNPDKNLVKYRILSNLYNSLPPTSALRYTVYSALVGFAASNDDVELIASSLTQLPEWLAQWQISPEQKEACLAQVSKVLSENSEDQKRAYDFHLLHLRFLSSSPSSAAGAKTAAEKAVVEAVSLPTVFDFESLLQIDSVQGLKGSPIGDLLTILTSGSAADYQAWAQKNKSEIERLSIPEAQLERKVKLLDLAELCASSVSKEIPYDTIASKLNVTGDEVELWVIDVIRAGLVSGKLSQVTQSFRVYRSTHRTFGKEQWTALEERLVEWQSAIGRILETVTKSRPSAAASGQADHPNAAGSGEPVSVA